MPAGKPIHAIIDNYAAHKHPTVRAWLARHPRWIGLADLRLLAQRGGGLLRHTLQASTEARGPSIPRLLQAAINRFLDDANSEPKPFRWIKDPDTIIAAVRRGHQALELIHWEPWAGVAESPQSPSQKNSERQVGLVCIFLACFFLVAFFLRPRAADRAARPRRSWSRKRAALERPGDRSGGAAASWAASEREQQRLGSVVPGGVARCRVDVLPRRPEESVVRLHAGFPGPLAPVSAPSLLTHCCVRAASPKTEAKPPFPSASPAISALTCVKSS